MDKRTGRKPPAAVAAPDDLTALLDRYHPGDRVAVGWVDAFGQVHTATVPLASGPAG